MHIRLLILAGFLIITLQACIYRMDIPQGNEVDPQKIEQLKTGMTRSQVEFLLGTAAINDLHHANQAHYVYYLYKGKEKSSELKKMILTYDADTLVNIDGSLQ